MESESYIFINQNKVFLQVVPFDTWFWKRPVSVRNMAECAFYETESYSREKFTINGEEIEIFCLEGLSNTEILERLINYLPNTFDVYQTIRPNRLAL